MSGWSTYCAASDFGIWRIWFTCRVSRRGFRWLRRIRAKLSLRNTRAANGERLADVIQRTYEGTLDCTALDGARDMDDVIDGYKATGVFRRQNWMFVRHGGADVGVLLLADHPAARQWELMYMGLVPEYRGSGWGRQIAHYAQWLARGAAA